MHGVNSNVKCVNKEFLWIDYYYVGLFKIGQHDNVTSFLYTHCSATFSLVLGLLV
jgi:hypothetical protein